MNGTLYLVPNLLGAVPPANVLPQRTIDAARALTHWVVETPKAARAFIKSLDPPQPIASLSIHELGATPTADHVAALQRLEGESRTRGQAQLFIETPYRNEAMLGAIATALLPGTQVCVAADLTLATETIERRSAGQWKKRDHAQFAKRPALFVLQA